MKKHYHKENDCLNCGTRLEGKFCYNCGQENLEIKESFGQLMTHAVSDYFHFDEKFFHTLKPLFFKPGFLTSEYMAGRRAQYLHPVKMYIFISLIYFLLVFNTNRDIAKVEQKKTTTEQAKSAVIKAPVKSVVNNKGVAHPQKNEKLRQTPKATVADIKQVQTKTVEKNTPPGDFIYKIDPGDKVKDTTYQQYLATQQKLPAAKRDGAVNRYLSKKLLSLGDSKVNKTGLITESINHNFPKMMFLLLPLFALILKVTFWRSKKFYVEHLIYSFHLHSFVFLFLVIIMLIQLVIPASLHAVSVWIGMAAALVIIWYIYRSLRVIYQRSRFRTIVKMIGMSLVYLVAFAFTMVLLVLGTAFTVV